MPVQTRNTKTGPDSPSSLPQRIRARSVSAKAIVGGAIGVVMAIALVAVQNRPADGPIERAPLALEVMAAPPAPLQVPERLLSSTSTSDQNADAIFVDPISGSADGNGRSPESALLSFQAALDRVEPGQAIYLMDGRYTELLEPRNLHYLLTTDGTADEWITIQNALGHTPVIDASGGNGLEIRGDYVQVIGLTVTGESFEPNADLYGNGLLIRDANHVRLISNVVSNMPLSGISAVGSANIELLDNEIFENSFWSSAQGSGISLWHSSTNGVPADADGYHDRIIGNRIYRNENRVRSRWRNFEVITDGNGIIIDEGRDTNYSGRVLVANNVIFDNGGRGILVYKSDAVDVMHNTLYRNGRTEDLYGGPAELVAGQARDVRFLNNLIWPRAGTEAIIATEAEGIETGGNLVVDSDKPGFTSPSDTIFFGDPGLRNPSIDENVADFRPLSASPLFNVAIEALPRLTTDGDGRQRERGAPVAGAYIEPAADGG